MTPTAVMMTVATYAAPGSARPATRTDTGQLELEQVWANTGDYAWSHLGTALSSAGDVNGDGYEDVVAGMPDYGSGDGRVLLYHGSAAGLETTAGWLVDSEPDSGQHLGISAATAGDVDGDGYDEVIVGELADTAEAAAYVYSGSKEGLSLAPHWTLSGPYGWSSEFGVSLGRAGDVNGDGFDDVVVGAPGADSYSSGGDVWGAGMVRVYLGGAMGLATEAAWEAWGEQDDEQLGARVVSAGDINGDGFDDIIVATGGFERLEAYLGSADGLAADPAWTVTGLGLIVAVAPAGDVNGDGFDDVVFGVASEDCSAVELYLGSVVGLGGATAATVVGDQPGSGFGYELAPAGDVDGDGYDDVWVGAPQYENGCFAEGRASLYLGSPAGLVGAGLGGQAAWTAESDFTGAHFGSTLAAVDVDGDGRPEVLVGAPDSDAGVDGGGEALVYAVCGGEIPCTDNEPVDGDCGEQGSEPAGGDPGDPASDGDDSASMRTGTGYDCGCTGIQLEYVIPLFPVWLLRRFRSSRHVPPAQKRPR